MVVLALQALKQHGEDIGIAFSGAEDVALVEYAHLTGRPYRVFRYFNAKLECIMIAWEHLCMGALVWLTPHTVSVNSNVGTCI